MIKMSALAVMAAVGAAAQPAGAGQWTWGVGAGFGAPVYYGPPPVYYGPPVVIRRLPDPPHGARVIMVPPPVYEVAPGREYHVIPAPEAGPLTPAAIFAMLEHAGYSDLGPMALRGRSYKVTAIDPDGNLVELRVSPTTGAIRNTRILQARAAPPPALLAAPRRVVVAPPPPAPRPAIAVAPEPQPVVAEEGSAEVATAAEPQEPSGPPPTSLRERLPGAADEQEPDTGDRDPLVVY